MSNCKVIALTNQKGGVGKTTTAVNLGVSLAKQGKTVLLVDADAQANLTMALGYTKTDNLPITLSDIMQDIIDGKSVDVQESILHTDEGVDLLPSCVELAGVETTLIDTKNRESVLKACISEVKKNYDYVLIDCMPALGMLTINGLAAADSVIIPNQPHYFSIKGLEQLLRSVSKVKRQINPNLRIDGILMTMVISVSVLISNCPYGAMNLAVLFCPLISAVDVIVLAEHIHSLEELIEIYKRSDNYGSTQNIPQPIIGSAETVSDLAALELIADTV